MPKSLYLHVPFCPHICPYCDFHKMRRNEALVAAYLNKLEQNALKLYAQYPRKLNTIYIGGGTPSHLNNAELKRLADIFAKTWGLNASEISFEADPLSFDKERLEFFKDLGFNRLSIGLQSSQDNVLKFLGRLHASKQGLEAIDLALEAGFSVSADIIVSVPEQNLALDLENLAKTGVQHISAYSLTIEANTPFAFRKISIDEEKSADDILLASEILTSYDFKHYELSNYAQAGFESQHNKNYWQGGYYLALGPGAVGFLPAKDYIGNRRANAHIKDWLADIGQEDYFLDAQEYIYDLIYSALRTTEGLSFEQVYRITGVDFVSCYGRLIDELVGLGMLEPSQTSLIASQKGLLQINGIVKRFMNY